MNTNSPEIRQFEIWTADLDPGKGAEPGKLRPVIIVQSNLLNSNGHTSFVVCPVSSQVREGVHLLRMPVEPDEANGLKKKSFILADQIRSLDQSRFRERVGFLSKETSIKLQHSLRIILNLD